MVDDEKSALINELYDPVSELFDLSDHVNALVKYAKHAKLQNKLAKTLQQENVTRWKSAFCCMIRVNGALRELLEISHARGRGLISEATKIDYELLKEFITFLEPFQEGTRALKGFSRADATPCTLLWSNSARAFLDCYGRDQYQGER